MVQKPPKTTSNDATSEENGAERRRFRRVETPLKARYLNEKGIEDVCAVLNVSAGGAFLRAKNPPEMGEQVVLYIDGLGRFEARVIRSDEKSFAVNYERKRRKNAKTADNLTEVLNRGRRVTDRRRMPRIEQNKPAFVYFEDGSRAACAIADISLTGASLEINPRPPLGTHIILGRMTAKVVRRHEKGVGVIFTGEAEKMDDVIENSATTEPPETFGPGIARPFGKRFQR